MRTVVEYPLASGRKPIIACEITGPAKSTSTGLSWPVPRFEDPVTFESLNFSWIVTDHGRPGLAKCLNDSSRRNRVPFSNVKASVTAPSGVSYAVVAVQELPLSFI